MVLHRVFFVRVMFRQTCITSPPQGVVQDTFEPLIGQPCILQRRFGLWLLHSAGMPVHIHYNITHTILYNYVGFSYYTLYM